ncbi:MAG: hypothetical protein A3E88_04725 [Legionellales bacterium RIFCSPHIGHO2_12_FULL_35_11]|nr:MAG: hypothetical protein A3E88_04725 [Legionellales bacterium RIFCSPHIGHO2_12_FULL_35_11]
METSKKKYIIANFYKFVQLSDYTELREPLLNAMRERNILGTILLASEGINGGFAGEPQNIASLYEYMRKDARFYDLDFKESYDDLMPFEKSKVKLRKEIVSFGVEGIDPLQETGVNVPPSQWNKLISDPGVVVIDTRNIYEFELGTFKNSVNPMTENFRDFPKYVTENLLDKKDKKIAMFCTGGIRCEKSTAYLLKLGFKNVYQLEGGILTYLKETPEETSLWEGGCFVFDDRITIDGPETRAC